MKLKAIDKKFVCKPVVEEHKTEGGIILPDSYKKDHAIMEVVSKGSKASPDVAEGDRILVSGFQGSAIKVDGEDYVIFENEQVLAVISNG